MVSAQQPQSIIIIASLYLASLTNHLGLLAALGQPSLLLLLHKPFPLPGMMGQGHRLCCSFKKAKPLPKTVLFCDQNDPHLRVFWLSRGSGLRDQASGSSLWLPLGFPTFLAAALSPPSLPLSLPPPSLLGGYLM